jgi:ribosomal protein S18 acetylase RimI-like enzyme
MHDFKLVRINLNHQRDLKELTPPDWNSDISLFYKTYGNEKYLYAIGFESENQLIACGFAIINDNIAWLGNIVVDDNFRNLGLGTKITSLLIEHCKSLNCSTILLIATKLGEPVYRKLGFLTESEYIFFRGTNNPSTKDEENIRKINDTDYENIFQLDFDICRENRKPLLKKFLNSGILHKNSENQVDGFFLPDFGNGFIAARNEAAGISLLQLKHIGVEATTVVPSRNEAAVRYLIENNFREVLTAPRMILGEKIMWKQECIFSRAAGYCG